MSVMSFDKGQNKTGERKRKNIMTQDTHESNLCLVPTQWWAFRENKQNCCLFLQHAWHTVKIW